MSQRTALRGPRPSPPRQLRLRGRCQRRGSAQWRRLQQPCVPPLIGLWYSLYPIPHFGTSNDICTCPTLRVRMLVASGAQPITATVGSDALPAVQYGDWGSGEGQTYGNVPVQAYAAEKDLQAERDSRPTDAGKAAAESAEAPEGAEPSQQAAAPPRQPGTYEPPAWAAVPEGCAYKFLWGFRV